MTELVQVTRERRIATIWLNRPERMNAISLAMWDALAAALAEVNGDKELRCLVLRGRPRADGRVAFGAGADIAEFPDQRANARQAEAYAQRMEPAVRAIEESPHPSIALIEGACVGGGLELALHCDLRIAGKDARLGLPIQRIGHGLPLTGLRPLVQLCGRSVALELLLEGRLFDAEEALAKGLVNRVFPVDQVVEQVLESADRIAAGAPLAHRFHREATRRALLPEPYSAEERRAPYVLCDSDDYKEGVRAFMAKEDPRFEGK